MQEKLEELAARTGGTWTGLAKVIGITPEYLRKIYRGIHKPGRLLQKRIDILYESYKDKV